MGIKNLKALLNKYAKEGIEEKYLMNYSGKIIAIDISIYLYKFIYKNGDPIELLICQAMKFLRNNIIPLYIFDGKPPDEKNGVLDERYKRKIENFNKQKQLKYLVNLENKEKNKEVIEEIPEICEEFKKMTYDELVEELGKIEKRIISITGDLVAECKKIFELMGIPYLVANGEAENLAACLSQRGIIYGCLSEDTDILANGGKHFIRNYNANSYKVIEYNLEKILSCMNLTYNQFIDVCILCGCDYTGTIKNIGIDKAYKFVRECNNIEGVLKYVEEENEKYMKKKQTLRYTVPEEFEYEKSRNIFKNSCLGENCEEIRDKIKLGQPNVEELIEFVKNKVGKLTIRNIEKNLSKYIDNICKKNNYINIY